MSRGIMLLSQYELTAVSIDKGSFQHLLLVRCVPASGHAVYGHIVETRFRYKWRVLYCVGSQANTSHVYVGWLAPSKAPEGQWWMHS
jgi:hypothetical protein